MDLADNLKQIADNATKVKDKLKTEEATKTSLIMPFIQALGYNVFDPNEVTPELEADVGIKKGEKVDYAILKDEKPIMLFECKPVNDQLTNHSTQIVRYFQATKARFAILTNGIRYLFYSDLEETNILDDNPFFEFNLLKMREPAINELKKFHRSYFDEEQILDTANELKYLNKIKHLLNNEAYNPSEDFVRYIISKTYNGRATQNVVEHFTGIIKKAFSQWLTEVFNDRIQTALAKDDENETQKEKPENDKEDDEEQPEDTESKIVTTEEEIEGYYIVKGILRKVTEADRIFYRDTQRYFNILLDNNSRKPICRLWLNGKNKYIELFDKEKSGTKHKIDSLDNIYDHTDHLRETVSYYNE